MNLKSAGKRSFFMRRSRTLAAVFTMALVSLFGSASVASASPASAWGCHGGVCIDVNGSGLNVNYVYVWDDQSTMPDYTCPAVTWYNPDGSWNSTYYGSCSSPSYVGGDYFNWNTTWQIGMKVCGSYVYKSDLSFYAGSPCESIWA